MLEKSTHKTTELDVLLSINLDNDDMSNMPKLKAGRDNASFTTIISNSDSIFEVKGENNDKIENNIKEYSNWYLRKFQQTMIPHKSYDTSSGKGPKQRNVSCLMND